MFYYCVTAILSVLTWFLVKNGKRRFTHPSKSSPPMKSCIYAGGVHHSRLTSHHTNQFSYDVYMMLTELSDAAEEEFNQYWFWSYGQRKKSIAWFDPKGYLSVLEVNDMVAAELGKMDIERVFLLTNWSYWGIRFNPISCYYCYDSSEKLVAMISEVHNTPWGEVCHYVHPCNKFDAGRITDEKAKKMHVSPFFGMDYTYRVWFSNPSKDLTIFWKLQSNEDKETHFTAGMNLKSIPITQSNLLWVLILYPLMTIKVVILIYWQAFFLWFKTPFVSHPKYKSQS
eukprot:TRINITY_DN4577_c0_g1_i1.p1 TRINITY_DN4577_c0_g1~~TRINITY_DN4577_c0_g1_i1.p1  ORF type:complete len:284 (-),score=18.21 TRINITY_DN4577_c0_g1_i1:160-1011(-)